MNWCLTVLSLFRPCDMGSQVDQMAIIHPTISHINFMATQGPHLHNSSVPVIRSHRSLICLIIYLRKMYLIAWTQIQISFHHLAVWAPDMGLAAHLGNHTTSYLIHAAYTLVVHLHTYWYIMYQFTDDLVFPFFMYREKKIWKYKMKTHNSTFPK